jgi:membrane-bound serine protease (ClpP class)
MLIGLAVTLFILEFTVTSHGLLTIAGIVCFALGASALYTAPGSPTAPDISVDPVVIAGLTALTAGYMVFILFVVVRWRRRVGDGLGRTTGPLVAAGTLADVRTSLLPSGVVFVAGEEWTARAADGSPIPQGSIVRVVRQDGLTVIVEPTDRPAAKEHP